jgi:DNA primase
MHLAHQPILEAGRAIIVEGYTDAISAHQAGFTNVVATAGTTLTPQHLDTLGRITTEITLAFDGDQAGLMAAQRTADLDRIDQNVHLRVARLPAGKDPADLIADNSSHILQAAIASAIPLEHHLIDLIIQQHNLDEPEAVARAIRAAGSVVSLITDPTGRAQTVAYIAERIGRDETLIHEYLQGHTQQPGRRRDLDPGRTLA